jgi:hypothetical protein
MTRYAQRLTVGEDSFGKWFEKAAIASADFTGSHYNTR